eukprot:7046-Eustigmatos_ZCMA.PRE.1
MKPSELRVCLSSHIKYEQCLVCSEHGGYGFHTRVSEVVAPQRHVARLAGAEYGACRSIARGQTEQH